MGPIYIKKFKSLNWSESTLAYGSLVTSSVCQLDIDLMIYAYAIFQLTDIMQLFYTQTNDLLCHIQLRYLVFHAKRVVFHAKTSGLSISSVV